MLPVSPTIPGSGALSVSIPTVGGKQLWRDTALFAGWRIQVHASVGVNRLLDPRNRMLAWGSDKACRDRLDNLRLQRGIEPASDHLVLLLHGIARSTGTFRHLQAALREMGYDAAAISYPSTRATLDTHADGLATLLDRLEGTKTVSFVTHSMGALVLRRLLAKQRPWQRRRTVGRIVLIAPPNQGAGLAGKLQTRWLYRTLYGPAGQQLTPDSARNLPGLDGHEFGIVAGVRGNGKGFNPFLPGEDDGTVALAETALPGVKATCTTRSLHMNIANHPETVRATTAFIRCGRFSTNQDTQNRRNQ